MDGDESLLKLFEFLAKQAPQFDYEKEDCYNAIYPNREYSNSNLKKLFAKGIQITEQFIQWNQLQESEILKNRLLTEYLEKKEATNLWEKQVKNWEKANQKAEWNEQFKENLSIAEHRLQYYSKVKEKKVNYKNKIVQPDAIADLHKVFEKFVIRYVLSIKNRPKTLIDIDIRKREFDFVILDQLVDSILNLNESAGTIYRDSHPAIAVAWKIYILVNDQDHNQYLDLKQLVEENKEDIPIENQLNLFGNLLYYCHKFYEKEGGKEPRDAFNIYKLILERKLCYKDGYLTLEIYYSLCNLSYILRETDWLTHFLATYTRELPKDEQFHYYHYFHALTCFRSDDYKGAVRDLEALEKANSYMYNFNAKSLLLMVYYESENDRFPDAINAFRVSLSRDKKSPINRVNNHKLFVNFLYQLYNCPKGSKKKLEQLKQKVEMTPFRPREWLLKAIMAKIRK